MSILGSLLPYSFKRYIRQIINKGNKHECPICGYQSKKLEPIGHNFAVILEKKVIGAGAREAGCYKCLADDRERLIFLYLRDFLSIFENNNLQILHIAPEVASSKIIRKKLGNRYVCGDKFTSGYSYPDFVQDMDILQLPFDNESFDILICNHVLEHIPDDNAAMKEIYRVLKPNGKAILQVPFAPNHLTDEDASISAISEKERRFGQRDHVRLYGKDYFDRLESVGFTTKRESLSVLKEYNNSDLNPREEVFVATKPA